jgi:hypothetical protein
VLAPWLESCLRASGTDIPRSLHSCGLDVGTTSERIPPLSPQNLTVLLRAKTLSP